MLSSVRPYSLLFPPLSSFTITQAAAPAYFCHLAYSIGVLYLASVHEYELG
jgi:hypothetical protein